MQGGCIPTESIIRERENVQMGDQQEKKRGQKNSVGPVNELFCCNSPLQCICYEKCSLLFLHKSLTSILPQKLCIVIVTIYGQKPGDIRVFKTYLISIGAGIKHIEFQIRSSDFYPEAYLHCGA